MLIPTKDSIALTADNFTYRDLNKNGRLDPYEDSRRSIEERVDDLLGQMTLEEKIGLMVQPMISADSDGNLMETPSFFCPVSTTELIVNRHVRHCNVVMAGTPQAMAAWYNRLQQLAESTRLGIPVTVSSDPRHVATDNPGAAMTTREFSHWPEPLGLAATRDAAVVEQFGDVARQEYLAVGIRTALHPMADLATEPRWGRMNGTFGEDAELAKEMVAAYIRGFQGPSLGPQSVSCMVKHFPGGGPQADGWDAHFPYGREQVYPGGNFDYHLIPFEGAFAAGVAQVMPYYGIPVGQTSEDVGMSFNKAIITGLLRERYQFDGIICTDWMICETNEADGSPPVIEATAWGVEHLPVEERYLKAIEAGVDQFGGQARPHSLIALAQKGLISRERIDASVRRLLRLKFQLGLFDNPYVDEAAVTEIVGAPAFRAAGVAAQRRSVVLLKNGQTGAILPLRGRPKLYVENVVPEVAARYGDIVTTPAEADYAFLRLATPYEPPRGAGLLERFFHQGDLDFKGPEKERILAILRTTPTIVDLYLERAAVIPEIAAACAGLLGTFSVSDEVVLDAIFGRFNPDGRLPIELPSSMEAVRAQKEDMPYDSANPLFRFGYGLSYT